MSYVLVMKLETVLKKLKFWEKEEAKKEASAEKTTVEKISKLKETCQDFKTEDLYAPMSRILLCDPRLQARDMDSGKVINMIDQGTVALYKGDKETAKKIYEKYRNNLEELYRDNLKELLSMRQYMNLILEKFDIVADIAKAWWEKEGVYKPLEEKTSRLKP